MLYFQVRIARTGGRWHDGSFLDKEKRNLQPDWETVWGRVRCSNKLTPKSAPTVGLLLVPEEGETWVQACYLILMAYCIKWTGLVDSWCARNLAHSACAHQSIPPQTVTAFNVGGCVRVVLRTNFHKKSDVEVL